MLSQTRNNTVYKNQKKKYKKGEKSNENSLENYKT